EFYLQEMADRKKFFYPPFVKIIKIMVKHKEAGTAETAARHLANLLDQIAVKKIILGPEKSLVSKIKNLYLYEILIKLDKEGNAPALFKQEQLAKIEELSARKDFKAVRFVVGVDPY